MNKHSINNWSRLCAIALILASCNPKKSDALIDHDSWQIDTKTLALAKPVNRQVLAHTKIIEPWYGSKILALKQQGRLTYDERSYESLSSRLSGRIERVFVDYNYQQVQKGQPLLSIYAPELLVAQRELLFVLQQGDAGLIAAAKSKLQYLGFSTAQLQQLIKTKSPQSSVTIYSPVTGYLIEALSETSSSTMSASESAERGFEPGALSLRAGAYVDKGTALFKFYNSAGLVARFSFPAAQQQYVKKAAQMMFYALQNPKDKYLKHIDFVQPFYQAGQNYTQANIYVQQSSMPIGTLLEAVLPVVIKSSWWLPRSAVVDLGERQVVFKFNGSAYVPQNVKLGFVNSEYVQVLQDLKGWQLAAEAAFMVDSESFIYNEEQHAQ